MRSKSNLILGLSVLGFAGLLLAIWIPLDVDTGLVEKQRRRTVIGDALAPTVAAVFLLIGSVGLIFFEGRKPKQPALTAQNMRFVGKCLGVIVLATVMMRYAGPISVWVCNTLFGTEHDYRLLRDTVPWKYIGFGSGGVVLVSGLITVVQGRLSWTIVAVGLGAVLALIAVYDLPFDDLLLPPNGDV